MFQGHIFPLKYEENIGMKFWIWKLASLLHTIFIIFYGVIGIICIKWIFGITQNTDEKFLIIFTYSAFIILYFMFGFIFMYLRVFLKPLKPIPQKIILTKDSIQINENTIKLNDIKNIIAPKDDISPWYKIYTDTDTWYTVETFLIPGLNLFLKNNFPNSPEYREQEQEKKIQQEL